MAIDPETGRLSNAVKYLTTISVFCGCLTFGCVVCFFSPALVDLKNKYATNIETMSKIFVIFPFATFCGDLAGGLLYGKLVQRQHGTAACFLGVSIVMFVVPHCWKILQIYICIGFLGFFLGAYDTAQTVWLMEIWQSKSGPFVQAQHFFFALGTTLPPFIVTPFLSDNRYGVGDGDGGIESQGGSLNLTTADNTDPGSKSNLYIPFTIAGSMALCNFCFEIFLLSCYKYEKPRRESQAGVTKKVSLPTISTGDKATTDEAASDPQLKVQDTEIQPDTKTGKEAVPKPEVKVQDLESQEAKAASDAKIYKVKLVILTILFIAFYVAGEMCSIQFISTFAQFGDLRLSETEGAQALAVLTASFAIGRGLGIFITIVVPPQIIICGNMTLIILGNVVLLVWANTSVNMLWLACALLGLGFSTMFASFFTIMRKHLEFNEFIASIILIGACTVEITYPMVVGIFIERNPLVLAYFNFLTCTVCATVAAIVWVFTNSRKSVK